MISPECKIKPPDARRSGAEKIVSNYKNDPLCITAQRLPTLIHQVRNKSPLRHSTKGQAVIALKSFFRTPPLFRHLTHVYRISEKIMTDWQINVNNKYGRYTRKTAHKRKRKENPDNPSTPAVSIMPRVFNRYVSTAPALSLFLNRRRHLSFLNRFRNSV